MKIFLATLLLLSVFVTSINLRRSHQTGGYITIREPIVGGFSDDVKVIDRDSLDAEHKKIDDFIRDNVPQVEGLKLISYTQQVVAGINYCYTYGRPTQDGVEDKLELCVWSKSWENNFMQVKRPNGQVVTSGGFS